MHFQHLNQDDDDYQSNSRTKPLDKMKVSLELGPDEIALSAQGSTTPRVSPKRVQSLKFSELVIADRLSDSQSQSGSLIEFSYAEDKPPLNNHLPSATTETNSLVNGTPPHANEEEVDNKSSSDSDSESEYSLKAEPLIWRFRMLCGKLVNNEWVQLGVIALIVINALLMGIATIDFVDENPHVEEIFSQVDLGFLSIFTLECAMQLIYLGPALFADAWLVFDLLIVVMSWSLESLQIVRALRIFRAFRLVTRVKPLRDLVLALGAVMPRMYAIAALLMLIFYIFSVLFTELFSELPLSDTYFTTLDKSLFTCMQMMTLEWGTVAREVMTYEQWAWAPFASFIMITGFIVFNLIVAVVCDAVALTEKTVRELDGFESDKPEHQLAEAKERIDLLQNHINEMLRTQEQVHELIEFMAAELLHLEAERMKAEHREAELRIEMERRIAYQTDLHETSLERSYAQEKEKREQERKVKELARKSSIQSQPEDDSLDKGSRHSRILPTLPNPNERRKARRRNSGSNTRSNFLQFRKSTSQEFSNTSLGDMTSPSSTRSLAKDASKASMHSHVSGSTAKS